MLNEKEAWEEVLKSLLGRRSSGYAYYICHFIIGLKVDGKIDLLTAQQMERRIFHEAGRIGVTVEHVQELGLWPPGEAEPRIEFIEGLLKHFDELKDEEERREECREREDY